MLSEMAWWLYAAGWLVLGVWSGAHAVMYKRDPRSAAIWIFIAFFFPFLGPWLYWRFGINRIERRKLHRLRRRKHKLTPPDFDTASDGAITSDDAIGHLAKLRKVADRVTRLPLLPGNAIHPLHNGEEAYPRMLEAIATAEHSVTLASYIFDWDEVGHDFADALAAAANRGVKVHTLVDGIGALGHLSRMGRRLLQSKVEVASFFPLRFPLGRIRLNLRNHRKTLVVDGKTGFTGGMNISARHLVKRDAPGVSTGLHFQVNGPVVGELQHVFVEDWALATGKVLRGDTYFPELSSAGSIYCRGIASGPDQNFETIHWILLAAFASAEERVRIVTPYFIPTASLLSAMAMASLRGVRIELVLPSTVDHPFMRWAADAYLWQLLEHGIRVYLQPPPFVHAKVLIVDDRWVLLGSANLDPRSFRLNFEFNVEAYDTELAGTLSDWIAQCIAASSPVTLEALDARPLWQRLRDGVAKLASPYL